jgi:beta-lactam-binding protein with PASTA domain
VTTVAGTASSVLSYEAAVPVAAPTPVSCKVPKLKGKKLSVAVKALRKANCKLGKVTRKKGATAHKAKVVGQASKPGTIRNGGSSVNVTLG